MNKIQEIIFYLCNLIVQDRIFSRLFHSVSVIFTWALIEGTSNGDLSEKLFRENIYTGKKQLEQTQDPATPLQTQENGNFQMKIITWDDGSQKSDTTRKITAVQQGRGSAQLPQELSDYLILIKQRIEANRHYPPAEQSAGHTAFITIRLTLDAEGNILNRDLRNPSSYPGLNQAAIESVKRAEPFPALPASVREKQDQLTLEFGLDYCLLECQ